MNCFLKDNDFAIHYLNVQTAQNIVISRFNFHNLSELMVPKNKY